MSETKGKKTGKKTEWQGLWAQRPNLYSGYVLKKDDIPPYAKLVLRYNKFYKKGSGRPKFCYCFADGKAQQAIDLEVEEVEDAIEELMENACEDCEKEYTYDDVQYAINRATQDALNGYTDNIVTDYLPRHW